jgi:ribosome maturation factor RimP
MRVDTEKLNQIVEPVVAGGGYELVDLEWKREASGWVLRVFIDGPGGVTIDDCTRVSHTLSATLDVSDQIPGAYNLEVSSPGLDRPLKKETDFRRALGQKAKIRTKHPVGSFEKGRRNFSGRLLAVENGTVKIDVGDQVCEVPIAEVEKAHVVFEFGRNE